MPYENVVDYLNSTIKEISVPGLSINSPIQKIKRGKEINYKPATNVNDIMNRELDITFRSIDSDLNYWLMFDIFLKHYLNVTPEGRFVNPFTITALDIHRDAIYRINFKQIVLQTLSELRFSYSDQAFSEKTFTLTFRFNFIDIEFLLTKEKLLSTTQDGLPFIQEIGALDPNKLNGQDQKIQGDQVNKNINDRRNPYQS